MTTHGDALDLSGRTVSHFRVLESLGAGGMGVVYRAEDVRLGRTVALKFMRPGIALDDEATARFLREARSVAVLDHPNICTVHEVGESDDGKLFLAMSYYGGETLKERLTTCGPLPLDRALEVAAQIARGLACAHAAGIVHRDLKPANVMLTPDGTVKILDFGLAKARDQTMTASGVAMGTVAYMSPEQLLGERVDARTDLWSLGVVLFEMLTGQHPSRGDDAAGTLERQVERQEVETEVTGAVRALADRLLRRNPEERYQSADDVLADLTALRQRIAAPPSKGRAPRMSVRNRVAVGAVAALALTGTVLGVFHWRRTQADALPIDRVISLAVLPLKNYSGPEQEYFADGMTEELIGTLTKIAGLHIIAHQSVEQFKRSNRPVPEIAQLLNVKYVVDGSVLQADGRVRITASLVDAARNSSVWSESFEGDQRAVMELQREVALAISKAVSVRLTPQDRTRLTPTRTPEPEALDLYLRGTRARYAGNFTGDFTDAIRYLQQSIAKDSSYAPTYAGLGSIYAFENDEQNARLYVDKAFHLDSNQVEGHMVRGMIREFFDWNMLGADSSFRRAIDLSPSHAEAHHELAMLLMRRRKFDTALAEARIALLYAPTSLRFLNGVGEVQVFAGQYADALATADAILASDSTLSGAYYLRGLAYVNQGRYEDAIAAWRSCLRVVPVGCSVAYGQLGYIYGLTGRRAQALEIVHALTAALQQAKDSDRGEIAENIGAVYAGLNDRNEALRWLEQAASAHARLLYLRIDPVFRSLREEPRFLALIKKVGLDR